MPHLGITKPEGCYADSYSTHPINDNNRIGQDAVVVFVETKTLC